VLDSVKRVSEVTHLLLPRIFQEEEYQLELKREESEGENLNENTK